MTSKESREAAAARVLAGGGFRYRVFSGHGTVWTYIFDSESRIVDCWSNIFDPPPEALAQWREGLN